MKIVDNIPETIKGVILMVSGLALLFHTLGILQSFLWYALIIISVYLIFIGFIKMQGIHAIKCLVKRDKNTIQDADKSAPQGDRDYRS